MYKLGQSPALRARERDRHLQLIPSSCNPDATPSSAKIPNAYKEHLGAFVTPFDTDRFCARGGAKGSGEGVWVWVWDNKIKPMRFSVSQILFLSSSLSLCLSLSFVFSALLCFAWRACDVAYFSLFLRQSLAIGVGVGAMWVDTSGGGGGSVCDVA